MQANEPYDGWTLHEDVDHGFLAVAWEELRWCPWCGKKLPGNGTDDLDMPDERALAVADGVMGWLKGQITSDSLRACVERHLRASQEQDG